MRDIEFSRGTYRRLTPNKVVHNQDGTTCVVLERKSGPHLICIIDTSIYDLIKGFRWSVYRAAAGKTYYAKTAVRKPTGQQTTVYMQNFVLPDIDEVDHRNGNGLDNRRENLRPATHSQNMANRKKIEDTSSRFIGVHWREDIQKFRAHISVDRKRIDLGHFDDEIKAAKVRDKKAKEIYGEFAKLNFPNIVVGEQPS